ncbi:MAG: Gfo/Idh/MocA family oxidoreductase [Verrucomicrobiae bacterium]|nr:Gfo/Idh/MocA family oxidoreductase [Verrucomicrobiae bacterium]
MHQGVAIVGYGYWGPNLVRNFNQGGRFRPVVVVEANPERLSRALMEYPGIEGARALEEVLGRDDIAAVAIATPVCTHFSLAEAALKAGKHVLVEKPIATTAADAEALVALALGRKRVLAVDHTYVYHPAVQRIRGLIQAGELGRINYVDSTRINLGLFQHDVNVLWDLAVHDVAIINSLIDERPAKVQAVGVAHLSGGIENIGVMMLRYASGLFVHINCSWVSPVKVRHMLIGGDRKMIVYDDLSPREPVKIYDSGVVARTVQERDRLMIDYRVGDVYSPRIEQKEALANCVADFADAIRGQGTPLSSGRFGCDAVRILEAAQASIREGGREMELTWK